MEIIRFGLLLTVTVALVTVAHRQSSGPHPSPTTATRHPAVVSTSSAPPSVQPTSPGPQPASPSAGPSRPRRHRAGGSPAAGTTEPVGAGASSLAVTGFGQAPRLAAVALLLIAGGALSLTASPARRRG